MQESKEIVHPTNNGHGRQVRFVRWTDALKARRIEMSSAGVIRTRLDRDWPATGSDFFDWDSPTGLGNYRERAQLLDAKNAIANGIVSRCVENVVSTGIRPQARSKSKRWNANAEAMFQNWAEFGADVRGLGDLYSTLQPMWFREYLVGGDVGIVLLADGSLQTIDGADIETPPEESGNELVVDGVQVNRVGRPRGFYVSTEDAKGSITYDRIRAQDFIFYPRPLRPKQTRGISALRHAIDSNLFDMIDGNIEAVVAASQMAAMFGLIIESEQGTGGMGSLNATTDSQGNATREFPMEPAMVKYLRSGEKITQVAPMQPSTNYAEFLAMVCRFLGLPFGLPLELILMDFSRTNYSSARASLLQAYRAFQTLQRRFVSLVLRRLYRWRISKFIKAGDLLPRSDAWEHTWITPGWPWVDPEKEAKAHLLALDGGWETLTEIALGLGKDFEDIATRRQQELERQRSAGMDIVHSNATRDAGGGDNAATEPEGGRERR